MTTRIVSDARRNPSSAIFFAMILLGLVSSEAICLENLWRKNSESRAANDQQEQLNRQMERHVSELKTATDKIAAVFARLSDGIIRTAGVDGQFSLLGHSLKQDPGPTYNRVAESIRQYGLVVRPIAPGPHERSVRFEAGSNNLELHRLVPILAEQENSNAFLFVDKLELTRPAVVPAFSMNPTGIEARFEFRVLSGQQ
jgi:hypothetical protein